MIAAYSNRRNEGQLGLILYETANWRVVGPQGVVLCEVASLRIAIDKCAELAARGSQVVALVRKRHPEIVVFSQQVRMLMNCLADGEVLPATIHLMEA
jgi:hypothetical protein